MMASNILTIGAQSLSQDDNEINQFYTIQRYEKDGVLTINTADLVLDQRYIRPDNHLVVYADVVEIAGDIRVCLTTVSVADSSE
jgi:hypothetical protein